jgi:chemotaxis protein CheZ
METYLQRKASCARWVEDMHRALGADDAPAFHAALEGFNAAQESGLMSGVRKVASDLQAALEQFRTDSRLVDLAERQVPDARQRLLHVLKLTDDAAHHTMDLVDQCCPLVEQAADAATRLLSPHSGSGNRSKPYWSEVEAFLIETVGHMKLVRSRLAEVLLAQGYQDLSGQILRSVMTLVDELEVALGDLVRIGNLQGSSAPGSVGAADGPGKGFGPVVPGVAHGASVSGQQDVDAMLSGLGF